VSLASVPSSRETATIGRFSYDFLESILRRWIPSCQSKGFVIECNKQSSEQACENSSSFLPPRLICAARASPSVWCRRSLKRRTHNTNIYINIYVYCITDAIPAASFELPRRQNRAVEFKPMLYLVVVVVRVRRMTTTDRMLLSRTHRTASDPTLDSPTSLLTHNVVVVVP
jgi:hypothetical protein